MPGRRFSLLTALLVAAPVARGWAAEIRVVGAAECPETDTIGDQVADLLGRPLGSVADIDFEVTVAHAPKRRWRLRLDTVEAARDGDAERRSREIEAGSCAELADAAAVTIAMAVRSRTEATAAAPAPPAPAPIAQVRVAPPPPTPAIFSASAALVSDVGALPQLGVGAEVGASVRYRRVGGAIGGTAFVPQSKRVSGNAGGEFRLLFASADACLVQPVRQSLLLACGGFELGRLSAEGVGLWQPRLGSTLWEAARAQVSLGVPVSRRAALVARAGIAAPLSRAQFVIDDGTTFVHRAAPVAVRVALGASLEF